MRQEQPLTFSDSEPQPDLALVAGDPDDFVAGDPDDFRHAHPTSGNVVIEVTVSSEGLDREKGSLYAAAGIAEYVIVLPNAQSVEVYSEASSSGYARRHELGCDDTLTLRSLPQASLDLAHLFT